MQTAESVCLWNYQFKNTSPPSSSSSAMNKLSGKKIPVEETPYLSCTERLSCQNEMSSKAMFYCIQCKSLQCHLCEKEIHLNSTHERLNLDEIDEELCAIDRRHQAVFYCPTCVLAFCYTCFDNQHQHSDGKEHKPQKSRDGQSPTTTTSKKIKYERTRMKTESFFASLSLSRSDQRSKPISINSPRSNVKSKPSVSSFEDVQVDDHDESPQKKSHHHAPKRHNFNEQMLLESMLDDGSEHHRSEQVNSNLSPPEREFLLLDNTERLTVSCFSLTSSSSKAYHPILGQPSI